MADQRDRATVEPAETGDERRVVGAAAIAVELDEVLQDPFDVVERVRAIGVACELNRAPDLLVARLGDDSVELPLEPFQLTRQAGAAKQGQAPEPAQALAQLKLGLTRHCRRGAAAARRSP